MSNAGLLELREALCRKLKANNGIPVDRDEIVVTHGAMGALYSAFVGLIEPGDEVLLPDPAWPNFTMMATLRSAVIRSYHLTAENGFLPDIDELEALVGPATKLLLINTPLNPIGSVIPRARMAALLDFAAAHDLWIICDEAYEALTYTDSFVSAASQILRHDRLAHWLHGGAARDRTGSRRSAGSNDFLRQHTRPMGRPGSTGRPTRCGN